MSAATRKAHRQGFSMPRARGRIRFEGAANLPPDTYGLRLSGTCLEPEAQDGDMALCSPTAPLVAGGYVVLWPLKGSRPMMKRLVAVPMCRPGELHPDSTVVPMVEVESLKPPELLGIWLDKLSAIHAVVRVLKPQEFKRLAENRT